MSHASARHRGLDHQDLQAMARDAGGNDDSARALVPSRHRLKDLRTMNDANRARPGAGRPKVKLLELWERTSARSGKTYLSGFLGGLSVVAFAETRAHPKRPDQELTVWTVYASEAGCPTRPSPSARGGAAPPARSRPHRHEGAKAQQEARVADEASQRHGEPELDDPMPF